MGEKLSYPTTIFLNQESTPTLIVPGYQGPNEMIPFLVYNAERLNETANINDFTGDFHRAFGGKPNDSTHVNWLSLEKAVEMQKIAQKDFGSFKKQCLCKRQSYERFCFSIARCD